ncbi:SLBB domain-containing protein [bacterium]|nr:SLBB domain-containing protein [bacterium]
MRSRCLPFLLALTIGAPAWSAPPTPGSPARPIEGIPSRLDASHHILQPGDQVEVHVFSMPELEKVYQIRADGSFFHPLVGEVQARGMTLSQLEAAMKPRIDKELKRSKFRLGLHSLAEAEASVMGEVHSQGMFKFVPGSSALDLIAHAGGLTNKADLEGAVVLREGKRIELNLTKENQTTLSNFLIQSGDVIYIHPGKRVGVSGEVHEKGLYAVSFRNGTIEDAIKAAGGASGAAALNRVLINRPSLAKPLEVNLLSKDATDPALLKDGDTVVVPARRVVVLGAVDKPGAVNLTGQEKLYDIISAVGTSRGRLDQIVVVRSADLAGVDPTLQAAPPKKEEYNLEKFFADGGGGPDVALNDGDLVFVPTKEQGQDFLNSNGFMNLIFMARSFLSF